MSRKGALDRSMAMNIDVDRHLSFTMNTKLFPMIGCPMGQSSGSYGYNPLFEGNGIDEIMWPVEIPEGGLGDFVKAFKTLGMRHFTITMPHKSAIIPYLDVVEEHSRIFNSVNAVRVDEDGKLHGAGFDGKGNMAAILGAGVDVKGMHVTIIGAGSIVGVILLCMAEHKAAKVTLINRSADRAQKLIDTVRQHTSMEIEYLPYTTENLDRAAAQTDLLMQATPQGLFGFPADYEYLGFIDKLKPEAVVMENIVNPPLTKFAARAKANGHKMIYGVDMMLGQLNEIFEFCFGFRPSAESVEKSRENVYRYFGLQSQQEN
ncbi:MAG TPA: saccharopine dehydrogenase NADP-binding domain-containing protein [Candidatus Egerieimonas intestinavium]|uniref:shikimate dehydrogenase (NADP(+)) n=1 Tax=Candidatus Egerieimonas intestinavium TaxID=2840777 RepID=A0A9D1JFE1_9FIRM|nr:saccharopine dehydrogenase NADP-binding domain-containing protein [Candidatus Egerieimonas intestinavium]